MAIFDSIPEELKQHLTDEVIYQKKLHIYRVARILGLDPEDAYVNGVILPGEYSGFNEEETYKMLINNIAILKNLLNTVA
jgi:hypothetical protein